MWTILTDVIILLHPFSKSCRCLIRIVGRHFTHISQSVTISGLKFVWLLIIIYWYCITYSNIWKHQLIIVLEKQFSSIFCFGQCGLKNVQKTVLKFSIRNKHNRLSRILYSRCKKIKSVGNGNRTLGKTGQSFKFESNY